jgi:hypothetical protein
VVVTGVGAVVLVEEVALADASRRGASWSW